MIEPAVAKERDRCRRLVLARRQRASLPIAAALTDLMEEIASGKEPAA